MMSDLYQARKSAGGVSGLELGAAEVALINQYTLRECTAEELFAFKVTACDNEIDRDIEAFPAKTLEQLAGLYVGKTILNSEHVPSTESQCARVYFAEVIREQGKATSYGDPYTRLEVKAYIPRTEGFAELIQLIETGIRKEVSVGCAIARKTCSICGNPYWSSECEHQTGMEYENHKKCFIWLEEARDAYEISFVAIPAQPAAGVTKSAAQEAAPPFLAELHGVMKAVKEAAAAIGALTKGAVPAHGVPPCSEAKPSALDDAEELIRSANALCMQYTNERES